jgi:hypothetical protein
MAIHPRSDYSNDQAGQLDVVDIAQFQKMSFSCFLEASKLGPHLLQPKKF